MEHGSKYSELEAELEKLGCEYRKNEPMHKHTSFRIGGPADIFIIPGTEDMLLGAVSACKAVQAPITIVGSGTNLLLSHAGIEGAVISTLGLKDITFSEDGRVTAGAGLKIMSASRAAAEHSLTGLEFAWGIPGSIGGAAYMNAGCYGSEMKDILVSCRHISMTGNIGEYSGEELKMGYRSSAYTDSGLIIISATMALKAGSRLSISEKMEELMQKRLSKQPYYMPSAGSTFKRPEGNFAGSLIESCGLKGAFVGGAQVSEKHAGFIVNTGGATCDDVLRLISKIKNTVYKETGIMLECEIKIVGRTVSEL